MTGTWFWWGTIRVLYVSTSTLVPENRYIYTYKYIFLLVFFGHHYVGPTLLWCTISAQLPRAKSLFGACHGRAVSLRWLDGRHRWRHRTGHFPMDRRWLLNWITLKGLNKEPCKNLIRSFLYILIHVLVNLLGIKLITLLKEAEILPFMDYPLMWKVLRSASSKLGSFSLLTMRACHLIDLARLT